MGRVGLEPKSVTPLTCGNATEADIHILLDPAVSASPLGHSTAVRYVPHGYVAAPAPVVGDDPPGVSTARQAPGGSPSAHCADSVATPPPDGCSHTPYRPGGAGVAAPTSRPRRRRFALAPAPHSSVTGIRTSPYCYCQQAGHSNLAPVAASRTTGGSRDCRFSVSLTVKAKESGTLSSRNGGAAGKPARPTTEGRPLP